MPACKGTPHSGPPVFRDACERYTPQRRLKSRIGAGWVRLGALPRPGSITFRNDGYPGAKSLRTQGATSPSLQRRRNFPPADCSVDSETIPQRVGLTGRHPVQQATAGGAISALERNVHRRSELYSGDFFLPKDVREALAGKTKARQRPHDEEIAAVPRRGVDQSTWLGDRISSVMARRTRFRHRHAGGRRGHAARAASLGLAWNM
jgi:hypothetical protein